MFDPTVAIQPEEKEFAPPKFLGALAGQINPHRILIGVIILGLTLACLYYLRWDWVPKYSGLIAEGIIRTLWLLVGSLLIGGLLAIPLGIAQVIGPAIFRVPARAFCTFIRGTPLLVQIFFLYYGLGSLFPLVPEIRGSFLWPYLREAWPYALLALSLSFAGYEGEIMRGAFAGVPKGELEAGKAYGMSSRQVFRLIWFPRAIQRVIPVISGEIILQLKATPLVATITVFDAYGVISRVRSDTYLTYEPLLLLTAIYLCIAGAITIAFHWLENRLPIRE